MSTPQFNARLASVRPLVRYVDEDQAFVEVVINLQPPLPTHERRRRVVSDAVVCVEVDTTDGFHDEQILRLSPRHMQDGIGKITIDIVKPQRWWPAGMGEQPLYDLSVGLIENDDLSDAWQGTVGLTSVSLWKKSDDGALLVNGKACHIAAVVPVDLVHEQHFLPVAGDSLMIVRGHWGPDVLYEAADRAGILLVQCIPVDDDGRPEETIVEQVDRLSRHPSLAGWYVGHLGQYTERMAYCVKCLDPTRPIFKSMPDASSPQEVA